MADSDNNRLIVAIERQTEAMFEQVATLKAYIDKHDQVLNEIKTTIAVKDANCKTHQGTTDRIFNDMYGNPNSDRCSMRDSVTQLSGKVDALIEKVDKSDDDVLALQRDFEEYKSNTNKYIVSLLVGLIGFIVVSLVIPMADSYIKHASEEKAAAHSAPAKPGP